MKKTILIFILLLECFTSIFSQNSFVDVAFEKGIEHGYGMGFAGGGVSFCDFNGDGWDDLTLATQAGDSIHFYINQNGNFVKIPALVNNTFEVKQCMWVDYDNDGDKDFYTTSVDGPNLLYQNDGNLILTDVTQASGLPMDVFESYGACWGDYNRDGFLDLYFTKRNLNFSTNQSWLYKNNGDGTFEDVTVSAGVADSDKAAFQAAFLDINEDLWQDIYTAHDKTQINTLLKNNGDLTYSDISTSSNSNVQINAMCVAVGDYDNDADLDIYVSNTPDGNKLLRNNGNETFSEVSNLAGVSFNGIGWASNFFDAENDGDLDLYVSGMSVGTDLVSSEFYENVGLGVFLNPDAGFEGDTVSSFGNAIGDFNMDGLPDIFVSNTTPFLSQLWENQSQTNSNNYLKIKLTGVVSNKDGVGSWINIFANGKTQVRYTHCGIGYLGQNSEVEIFGLGEASSVDSIHVKWLTGHVDKLFNVDINQTILIEEGSTTNGDIFIDPSINQNPISTNDIFKKSKISIFPNPSNGDFNFKIKNEKAKKIQILDLNGKIIFEKKFDFPVNFFSKNIVFTSGSYFTKIYLENEEIHFSKLIIF